MGPEGGRLFSKTKLFAIVFAFAISALAGWAETLPSGTRIVIRLDQEIRPTGKPGQHFSAPLAFAVFSDGQEMLPLGSRIEGEVRGSKKSVFLSPHTLLLPNGHKLDFNAEVSGIDHKTLKADENEGTIESKRSIGPTVKQAGEVGIMGAEIGAMTTGSMTGMGIGAAAGIGAVIIAHEIAGHHGATVVPAGTEVTLSLVRSIDVPNDVSGGKPADDSFSDVHDRRPILRRIDDPNP
jgi:hypothetical protein